MLNYSIIERKIDIEEIKILKKQRLLELPWDCLNEEIFLMAAYEINGCLCAVIRISADEVDNAVFIDEFEVIKDYREKGIGIYIIKQFIYQFSNMKIKLLAKNKFVAEFWYKCGFNYCQDSWAEIPMEYNKC